MARFFFNLHECGTVLRDDEGVELPDMESARSEAFKAARAVMSAEVEQGRLCLDCHIEIQDGLRERLMVVAFKDAVAVSGR